MKYQRGIRKFILPSIFLHICIISLLIFLLKSSDKQNELSPYEVAVIELHKNGISKDKNKAIENKQPDDIRLQKPVKAIKKHTSKKNITKRNLREKPTVTLVNNAQENPLTNSAESSAFTDSTNASEIEYSSVHETQQAYPDYNSNPKPDYPLMARRRGYEGTVMLRVKVLKNGKVGALNIEQSSRYEILDKTALDTVSHWTFIPAIKNSTAVNSWVTVPIKFELKDR